MEDNYRPSRPYIFKRREMKGLSMEKLAFLDYRRLMSMQKELCRTKNVANGKSPFELHLNWILTQGEKVDTEMLCPQCKQSKIRNFMFTRRNGEPFVSLEYTACDDPNCIRSIKPSKNGVKVLPFKLSTLGHFSDKEEKKRVVSLFKRAFGLEKLRKDHIFELLCKAE